ncbi:hypothetical protein [Tenacibaculum maritimum]|uniref:hypothetical protein n=1 Tax=Tenacibaculum maritimum TaxID=107401 RepID=UPI00132F929C|nr:hypothetical protein [Tenacibaculum maritimum]MCD9609782.1 hypothetical protein [Tenacibaculum maritimum]
MTNLYLNTSNGILGVAASITEQTPLPVIMYAFLLAVTEYYKYKRSKNDSK